MQTHLAHRLLAAILLLAHCATGTAQTQKSTETPANYAKASDIPVEVFFRPAQHDRMTLSPDGRKIAALLPRNGRINLGVIDLEKRSSKLITNFTEIDVSSFRWLSNDRLFLLTADMSEATGNIFLRGRWAINVDGTELRDLWRPTYRGSTSGASGTATEFNVLAVTADATGEVIVEMNERNSAYVDLYRYNTRTGEYKLLTFETPGDVVRWVLDKDLVPRIAMRLEPRKDPTKPRETTMWHRASASAPWELIARHDEESGARVSPIAFDYDNKTLYVSTSYKRDKSAIFKYDIAEKKLGEKLVEHPLIDLNGGLIFNRAKRALVGISYSADEPGTAWFDSDFAKLQAGIDKALPNRFNSLQFARDTNRYVLIDSVSPTNPAEYLLLDREKGRLEPIANSRPWLPPALLGERKFIRYKARDGREIPAWVTLPREKSDKPLPLVVHIHGGPWVRAYHGDGWDGRHPVAQFLASRGYAVLEPEPRGSTGFGRSHLRSSYKQWGLAMQDDITDGALHLVNEGIVDKSRMCLFGGSYGGYATLQGLVKDPDLWRCGHAFVAVTDLELMQTIRHSDTAMFTDYFQTDFKWRVGDKDADREQFEKTSPLKNAAKIKAAVMLTMGGSDVRVPIRHGEEFRAAMDRAGKKIDYKVYADEAHGFNKRENVIDFFSRTEKFFAEHLK